MSAFGVEVWRGGVKSEQIDEMGHLNVRFYVAIATEGLAGLAAALGMPGAFKAEAGATLMVREHHIRFLREAHARAPLHMTAGVLEMGEDWARVLFVLWHSVSGEPAASFNTVVAHVTAREARPFPWPSAALERAKALAIDLPPFATARSTPLDAVVSEASEAAADALGLPAIAMGAIEPADCDAFGRMQAQHFMGSIVSGIPQLGHGFRNAVVEATDPRPTNVGNAALEYRLLYLDWPRTGDLYRIRSAMREIDGKGMHVVHWMLDPVSGRAWGSCQAYIVTFDLSARKIIPVPPAAKTALAGQVISEAGL